ncbi:13648_t:CDS:2 [Entrophospora sp. SA101]|nr:13648_t:CDS:2 [Entrophospora sp. SA101]
MCLNKHVKFLAGCLVFVMSFGDSGYRDEDYEKDNLDKEDFYFEGNRGHDDHRYDKKKINSDEDFKTCKQEPNLEIITFNNNKSSCDKDANDKDEDFGTCKQESNFEIAIINNKFSCDDNKDKDEKDRKYKFNNMLINNNKKEKNGRKE